MIDRGTNLMRNIREKEFVREWRERETEKDNGVRKRDQREERERGEWREKEGGERGENEKREREGERGEGRGER